MELTLGAARHQREEDVVELLHPLGVLGLVRLELETLQQPSPAVKSERKLLLFSFFFLFFTIHGKIAIKNRGNKHSRMIYAKKKKKNHSLTRSIIKGNH